MPKSITAMVKRRRRAKWVQSAVVAFVTLIVMIPLVWMIFLSFKDSSSILNDPLGLPDTFNFSNYSRAFDTLDIGLLYKNTFVIAAVAISIQLIITYFSAFAIARLTYKNRWVSNAVYLFFIAGHAISPLDRK